MESNKPITTASEHYPDKKEYAGEKPDLAVINNLVNRHGNYLLTMGISLEYAQVAIQSALENMDRKISELTKD